MPSREDLTKQSAAIDVVQIVLTHFRANGIIREDCGGGRIGMAIADASQSIEHLVIPKTDN